MPRAFTGKAGAVARDIAEAKRWPVFLYQPAQEAIGLCAKLIQRFLFSQSLVFGQVVVHQRRGALNVHFFQGSTLLNHRHYASHAQNVRGGFARSSLHVDQLAELPGLAFNGVVNSKSMLHGLRGLNLGLQG